MTQVDWLIIGAGVAGCRMAHLLSSQGYSVVILEKSRGLGGRLCHRRTEWRSPPVPGPLHTTSYTPAPLPW